MQLLPNSDELPSAARLLASIKEVRNRLVEAIDNADSSEQYIDVRVRKLADEILAVEDKLKHLPENEKLTREIYTESYSISKQLKHLSRRISEVVPVIEANRREELAPLAKDTTALLTQFSSWLKDTQSTLVSREAKRDFPMGGMNYGQVKEMEAIKGELDAVQTSLWACGLDNVEITEDYMKKLLEQLRSYENVRFPRSLLSRLSMRKNNEYYSFNVLKVLGRLLNDAGLFSVNMIYTSSTSPLIRRVKYNAGISLSIDIIEFMRYLKGSQVNKTYLHQAVEINEKLNSFYNRHLTLDEKTLYRDQFRALSKSLEKIESKYS